MMRSLIYLSMLCLIYLYSYAIGGQNVMLLLFMFTLTPLVSFLMLWGLKNKIDLRLVLPKGEVEKNGIAKVRVVLVNRSFLPVPFIELEWLQAKNFQLDRPSKAHISLGPYEKKEFFLSYQAHGRGVGRVGIKAAYNSDFMRFLKISLHTQLEESERFSEITVLPRRYPIRANTPVLLNAFGSHGLADEKQSNGRSIHKNGEPGYEFRTYEPGDPLHKIHWKLSAKKDSLMIRLEEGAAIAKKCMILDPSAPSLQYATLQQPEQEQVGLQAREDKILEALLSIADLAIASGRQVEIWIYDCAGWKQFAIHNKKDVLTLQHTLAPYAFVVSDTVQMQGKRMPLEKILQSDASNRVANAKEIMLFTANYDTNLQEEIAGFYAHKLPLDVITVQGREGKKALPTGTGSLWTLGTADNISEVF